MIDTLLQTLSQHVAENFWLAPFLALTAGVLTSFMPCCLSSIPLIVAFLGRGEKSAGQNFLLSCVYALGMATTFTLLGVLAALLGQWLQGFHSALWYLFLGLLMVLMALQTWGLFTFLPPSYLQSKNTKRGALGAYLTGLLAGLFSSPCSTPVLIALLSLVSAAKSPVFGTVLLLCYAIGHSFLTIVAGTFVGVAKQIKANEKYGRFSGALNALLGFAILLLGLYMFYLGF